MQAKLPSKLDGSFQYNVSGNENLTTFEDVDGDLSQLVTYWGDDRRAKVSIRRFPEGEWSKEVDVSDALGCNTVDGDSHNNITIGIDTLGYIYVAGDHHVDPLYMCKSDAPYTIHSGFSNVNRSLLGTKDTDRVTYPEFFYHGDDLCFSYREQDHTRISGKTAPLFIWYLKKLDVRTGKWSEMAQINTSDWVRMYVSNIAMGPSGLHLCGLWRDEKNGGGPDKQQDLFHIMSMNGTDWTYIDGTHAELPFAYYHNSKSGSQTQLIWDTSKGDPKPFNMLSITVDDSGMPHMIIPDRQKKYYYIRRNEKNTEWVTTPIKNVKSDRTMEVTTFDGDIFTVSNFRDDVTMTQLMSDGSVGKSHKISSGVTNSRTKMVVDRRAEYYGYLSCFLTKTNERRPANNIKIEPEYGYVSSHRFGKKIKAEVKPSPQLPPKINVPTVEEVDTITLSKSDIDKISQLLSDIENIIKPS